MTIEAFERTLELAVLLGEEMERRLAADGLTPSRAQVLRELGRRGPLQQRELAGTLAVSARNITGLVDGLAATGFVTREPHPDDRRATLVTLTGRGTAAVRAMEEGRAAAAAALFEGMRPERLAAYAADLDVLLGNLRKA
ncbi:MarR family winged helix-turn-helix transcriptional regulator [Nonomuraea endophytica]|uniref:DNA-binding MarR family transcriptional regulator n=1 Tax=Nonomuraea endophytica TaxID=714136 RepID=A0A7W8EIA8_9ACTN|nr:MarR family transcriptional regulator [Nonomuraea endophytica]MBB5080348.1 DNA-binding MarR family transcriptional regulator [Nonomuraea endophytica]